MPTPSKAKKDPVCGMTVDESHSPHKCDHNHKHYSFCSKECLTKFKQNPKQFAKE